MSEGDWISVAILGVCALMSAPGIVIALRKSARRGIVVNLMIYLVVATALVLRLFVENKLDHGTWGPESWPFFELGYVLFSLAGIGVYCLIFQVIGITAATVIRSRRTRSARR